MLDPKLWRFEELYEKWTNEEPTSEDPLKLINLARKLTELDSTKAEAWDALATSIMGYLFPPGKELLEYQKQKLRDDPLFWEMVYAFGRDADLTPNDSAPLWNRAICFDEVGIFNKAYEDYLNVSKISREENLKGEEQFLSIELLKAGQAIFKYGDYDKATRAFKESIEAAVAEGIDDDTVGYDEAWYFLGLTLEKLNNHKEALDAYREAAELNYDKYGKDYEEATTRFANHIGQ